MKMRVSQKGLVEIASHEAIVQSRYKDSVNVWTIGIGHTKNAGAPDPATVTRKLSIKEVMEIFARDVVKFENRVNRAFIRPLTQSQFDAAVSFDFNTGGIHRATWVKQFNKGNISGARKSFMAWSKPKEIIPRRQAECDLFFKGAYSNNGYVSVYNASRSGQVQWSSGKRIKIASLTQSTPPQPVNVDVVPIPQMPEGLDKPMVKSKTNWLTMIQGGAGSALTFLADLNPYIQALIILLICMAAGYVIYERKRYRDEARAIKAGI